MMLPVVSAPAFYHLGSLQAEQRQHQFRESMEGHCLSISLCPLSWSFIARLGGAPLWKMAAPEALLLDVMSLSHDERLVQLVRKWGKAHGLVVQKTLWRAWQYDCECDEWRYSLWDSKESALAEVDDETEGPQGIAVESTTVLCGTPKLAEKVMQRDLETRDAFAFLAMVWAEETQPELDGIWWSELFDPQSLSAPRGGLFPGRLARWTALEVSRAGVDEEELLASMTAFEHPMAH